MAFFNQGARPNYLSSIDPIQFRERDTDYDQVHGHFQGTAITFLSQIRPEDFNAPRALWEKVWDEPARERFVNNVAGKMEMCKDKEILKRQIAIFREVSDDAATRLEKATGIKGYDGIKNMKFNGTHNGMSQDASIRQANGIKGTALGYNHNGAPTKGSHNGLPVGVSA